MAGRRSEHPTMYELLSKVYKTQAVRGKNVFVTDGKRPSAFPQFEGEVTITPSQALSIRVPVMQVVENTIRGYQRKLIASKARAIARWILNHPGDYLKEMQIVEISLDDGMAFASDGQHRLAGAIIADKPIKVVVTKRTQKQAKALFANQAKQTRVNRNTLIFDSEGVIEEYIQDAATDVKHPWHDMISIGASVSKTSKRITAATVYVMVQNYAVGLKEQHVRSTSVTEERFDKRAADELADLIRAFGDRQINPFAFSATGLRAIARAARAIMTSENAKPEEDRERWERHMVKFPFAKYQYLSGAVELAEQMVRYWNKNLSADRRIDPSTV